MSAPRFKSNRETKSRFLPLLFSAVLLTFVFQLFNVPSANAAPPAASISQPICVSEATVTLTTTQGSSTQFEIRRSSTTASYANVLINGSRTTSIKVPIFNNEILKVKVGSTTLVEKTMFQSSGNCPLGAVLLPTLKTGVSASVSGPSCGSNARIVLNNGKSTNTPYEIWRQGQTKPDMTVNLSANRVTSFTNSLSSNNQAMAVISNSSTLARTVMSPQPADQVAGWGCPIGVDHFNGTALSSGIYGWTKYHSPTATHPRSSNNLRVQNGELQLVGTFNQSTQIIQGAGAADKFAQMYGRWETRMKVELGAGYSAVSLLWPHNENWPTDGEIDIFEVPKQERERLYMFVHNGPDNAQTGMRFDINSTQWHTYTVEWTPARVTFFVDNVWTYEVTDPALVPHGSPMHMTLQFDAQKPTGDCTGWYQCPTASTPPEVIMHIDYVKVWQQPS